jgi:aspartyl aminopeptidase
VDRGVNDNFKFNQETEFVPILGLIASQLNAKDNQPKADEHAASSVQNSHHPALLSALADELSITSDAIHDFELFVLVLPLWTQSILTEL